MARYQVRPREDGNGPYAWHHVVKRPNVLAQGDKNSLLGDELNINERTRLIALCDEVGFEMRRVA